MITLSDEERKNFDILKESVSDLVIEKLAPSAAGTKKRAVKGRKKEIKPVARLAGTSDAEENDATALGDFAEYIADEIFLNLSPEARKLSFASLQDDGDLTAKYALPLDTATMEDLVRALPLTIADSLCSYGLITDSSETERFLEAIFSAYIATTTSPPAEYTPEITATRPAGCEVCQREHVPLTYHHLIPRQMHAKAVKRGWHREWQLSKVAWLCRACHSYVHKIATNEELARELYSVELLMQREDVQKWAGWVGRVRWKAR